MSESENTQRYCRYCGKPVRASDTFCMYCGKRRSAPKEGPSSPTQEDFVLLRSRVGRAFSPSLPTNVAREIVTGALLAAGVAALLVGMVYALLALRGAFEDPSVPRTLGLVIFSLVHGGAFSVSVPSVSSLLDIGGSFWLGLPPTSFALLPFVTLLVLSRFVARWTQTVFLFACSAAITYALVVGLLAALGSASVAGADNGTTVQYAADPLSAAWRAFLLAMMGTLLGAAATHGPLLTERLRQVLRGAFAAIGISLVVTVLLTVVLLVLQGGEASTPQIADGQTTQLVRGDSPTGNNLAGIGVLFALLPTILSTLWLFAHGLPMGLQGAQELTNIPLVGGALANAPLRVSLLGNWPGGSAWRLLLLGPVVGLVVGGMFAARGAPRNERWWQGALVAVPYAVFSALLAILFRITAKISVAALTLDLSLGASLPWLLALLPVGGALGAIGGLLAGRGTVWAANPRLTFLATSILSAILLVGSLPSALAVQPRQSSNLLSSTSPISGSPDFKAPETSSTGTNTKASSSSSSRNPSPASTTDRQDEKEEASETNLRQAVEDYYGAVDREDWDYTYDNLDSRSRRMFTREEWRVKNQYFADNGSLPLSSFDITEISPSGKEASVSLGPPFSRVTYFVYEDGSWKHRLSEEEIELFTPGVPFEDTTEGQKDDSTDDQASQRSKVPPTKQEERRASAKDASPGPEQPQWQTTDPNGPYYHPPQGPCLGQCTDAYGRNNADLQNAWMQMRPEEKAAERARNMAAGQSGR